jgi:hypothetical protein
VSASVSAPVSTSVSAPVSAISFAPSTPPVVDFDEPLILVWNMHEASDEDMPLVLGVGPGVAETVRCVAQPTCLRLLGAMLSQWTGVSSAQAKLLLDSNILGAFRRWLAPSRVAGDALWSLNFVTHFWSLIFVTLFWSHTFGTHSANEDRFGHALMSRAHVTRSCHARLRTLVSNVNALLQC